MMNITSDSFSNELQQFFMDFDHKVSFKKGDFLFQEGSTSTHLFFITSGAAQVGKVTPEGRELTLQLASSGDLVGEVMLFCGSTPHMLQAKAIEPCTAIIIQKRVLENELTQYPALSMEYMKWMGLQIKRMQTKFRDLILNGKKGALYSTLIRMSNSFGVMKPNGILLNVTLTNQEIANLCGTSREVVNRMLAELRKNEVISMADGKIIIHKLSFLKKEIDCEDCPVELCRIE
ncbi:MULTISPECIES: Crp/Fnr family transcriptional regulator [Priestia]|jgi:CRP-like cAMP-binding protein|uniref:Crp/Fnr family transcriptional regulator n=1 Tax=Priestia TaxID=2800373 RepID=UPI0008830BC5|nr:Crp/Fnr family transcriptional regulator [Priestia aryabhattai]MBK0006750.1 Crp/Fnr family transcriptional regulator [Bacillus sp. S35]MCM3641042.1 Crp/Fnr family transcriptional regulator [Priestia aryabhattai]PFW80448.1 Crp/Fnr family transcriptional regulator [Priestia aryabhattai]SDD05669.1 CRP/FNR family transcriptional regulator, anaerobic regulatory protein [Priestia aryabhattai B8W22]